MTTKTLTPPKPVVRDEFYEAALAWAQEFTEGLEELPRGRVLHGGQCPLGRALNACVTASWVLLYGRAWTLKPPPLVAKFIRRFDRGHYPDLIER